MRTILPIAVAAVLSAATFTATADDSVKTAHPPYKPGRQIDNDSVKTSQPPYKPGRQIDNDSVKTSQPPYKPGRQIDNDSVKTSQPPYKPGRQIDNAVKTSQPPTSPSPGRSGSEGWSGALQARQAGGRRSGGSRSRDELRRVDALALLSGQAPAQSDFSPP